MSSGRQGYAGCGYGTDKGIFAFGGSNTVSYTSSANLISNTGVIASDTTSVGSPRSATAACTYNGDKGIVGFGYDGYYMNQYNLISNLGVIGLDAFISSGRADKTDVYGRSGHAAASFGGSYDSGLFAFGTDGTFAKGPTDGVTYSTVIFGNTGTVKAFSTFFGTARKNLAATSFDGYGPVAPPTPVDNGKRAIFGFGDNEVAQLSVTNQVSSTGLVSGDSTNTLPAMTQRAAAGYGGDKGIFGFGFTNSYQSITNLVSPTGVIATFTVGVGTPRRLLAAAGFGGDQAIFAFGTNGPSLSMSNLVSNTGVVGSDNLTVGKPRDQLSAAGFGNDKAIFLQGHGPGSFADNTLITNIVSNTGVIGTDSIIINANLSHKLTAAATFGYDKAIFGYGIDVSYGGGPSNIVYRINNVGVFMIDSYTISMQRRYGLAASSYGGDKAIFGYGRQNLQPMFLSTMNTVSNTGDVASDITGAGTARSNLAASTFG